MRQYHYRDHIRDRGTQLMHNPFFQVSIFQLPPSPPYLHLFCAVTVSPWLGWRVI